MATLAGNKWSDRYKDVLQVSNAGAGLAATLRDVESGGGTVSALQLSTGAVNINGDLTFTGTMGGAAVIDYQSAGTAGPGTTASTAAYVDIDGGSISVVTTVNALVSLQLQCSATNNNNNGGYVVITDSGNTDVSPVASFVGTGYFPVCCIAYQEISAGTTTYKGRFEAVTGGTVSLYNIRLQGIVWPR